MVRKAAGEYSKTKEEQLGQAVKAAFDWFSTCYGAITKKVVDAYVNGRDGYVYLTNKFKIQDIQII